MSSGAYENSIHVLAGAIAGTSGAVCTCPLEVVKTRLQSSVAVFDEGRESDGRRRFAGRYRTFRSSGLLRFSSPLSYGRPIGGRPFRFGIPFVSLAETRTKVTPSIAGCLKYVCRTEGLRGLFKGIGPNLVGVAPSRAIYFAAYSHGKHCFNDFLQPDSPLVHVSAAALAGFCSSTCTNPLWVVKTRLQLDQRSGTVRIVDCVRSIIAERGVLGFWFRGISASYYGIAETIIHFSIYEALKGQVLLRHGSDRHCIAYAERDWIDFALFMASSGCSKSIAASICYPHEVARTRLRQSGDKYRQFWQTLSAVVSEEGMRGLYRGLGTHLVRQVPNTAITMVVYEAVVYSYNHSSVDRSVTD